MRNKSLALLLASLMLIMGLVPFGTLAEEPHVEDLDTEEQSLHPVVDENVADLPGEDQVVDLELDGKIDTEGEVTEGEKGDLSPEEVEPDGSGDEDDNISETPGREGDQEAEDSEQRELEISEEKIPEAQKAGLPENWGVILVDPNGEIIAVGDEEANVLVNIEISVDDIPTEELAVTFEATGENQTFGLSLGKASVDKNIRKAYFRTYHTFYQLYQAINPDMTQYNNLDMLITIHRDIPNMDASLLPPARSIIRSAPGRTTPYKLQLDTSQPLNVAPVINVIALGGVSSINCTIED